MGELSLGLQRNPSTQPVVHRQPPDNALETRISADETYIHGKSPIYFDDAMTRLAIKMGELRQKPPALSDEREVQSVRAERAPFTVGLNDIILLVMAITQEYVYKKSIGNT